MQMKYSEQLSVHAIACLPVEQSGTSSTAGSVTGIVVGARVVGGVVSVEVFSILSPLPAQWAFSGYSH